MIKLATFLNLIWWLSSIFYLASVPFYEEKPKAIASNQQVTDTVTVLTKLITQHYPDYRLLDWKNGDVTRDGLADFIVVAESRFTNDAITGISGTRIRKALIVENVGFPKLKIVACNEVLVECSTCGGGGVGDAHHALAIKRNYFSFESLYGGCTKTFRAVTFKYHSKSKNWLLHRLGYEHYSCQQTDEEEVETIHFSQTKKDFGRITFEEFDWGKL